MKAKGITITLPPALSEYIYEYCEFTGTAPERLVLKAIGEAMESRLEGMMVRKAERALREKMAGFDECIELATKNTRNEGDTTE